MPLMRVSKCQSKSHIQEEPGRVKNTDIMRLSEVWDPDWGKRDMCSFFHNIQLSV